MSRVAQRWRNGRNQRRGYSESEVEPGVRLRLYFDSELAKWIANGGFEITERQFIKSYLRPGDIFVDVGANIGLFTVIAARSVGVHGKVCAFEPCVRTFARLNENVTLNNQRNILTCNTALSDRTETRKMITSRDGFDAWNSLAQPFAGKSFAAEQISCITWDNFSRDHGLVGHVTLMKIDVEGWELRVIEGAAESLLRDDAPDLLVEFADTTADLAGSSCRELYDRLVSFGYRMFTYNPEDREINPEELRVEYEYANLIATKSPERLASRARGRSMR
ncbi:MAG: FkbM family methyltransferase [Planctomycetota bacterium]|nr:FkbM family methyltransferase [Planctomycetota bacterium]